MRSGDQQASEEQIVVHNRPIGAAQPLPDPAAFFKQDNTDAARAAFASIQARRMTPPTLFAEFAKAIRLTTAVWAIFPIAIAIAYLWALNTRPIWGKPQLMAVITLVIAVFLTLCGVNMLRAASSRAKTLSGLVANNRAQIGIGLLASGALAGIFIARGHVPAVLLLGGLGWLAGTGYALAPLIRRPLPGIALLPALVLGPILFFLTLNVLQDRALQPTNGTWLLAGALLGMIGARLVAHLLTTPLTGALAPQISERMLRRIYLVLVIAAYSAIVLAATGRHMSHGALAVLLSLPQAILPLSGVAYAKTSSALRVIESQTQRMLIGFGGWLVVGFFLGGLYLRFLANVHAFPGIK